MEQENRVVVLIDMDCFYCQVEEKLDPELKGKPIAVVQYNPWKGGGIIAVNYVARARGVTRHMRGDEAKEKCPEIQLPSVPCHRGKADISKYRDAGKEVARILQKFTPLLERASIDEAYLDITAAVETRLRTLNTNTITPASTPNTFALGYDSFEDFAADVRAEGCGSDDLELDCHHNRRLLAGAVVVGEIRAKVFEETGYTCSAGIAHNKILAKLVCGMNKPNKQTVLPKHSVNILYKTLPLKKVKHLGGKFGDAVCEVLRITLMGDLQQFTEKELQAKFDEKNGTWLYNIARGVDPEPVQARFNPKSIGCCKQFRGKSALLELEGLRKWLGDLGDEIEDRLEKDALENNRTPKQMVVSFASQQPDGRDATSSRSYNFAAEDELAGPLFAAKALHLILDASEGGAYKDGEPNRKLKAPIKFLGISVGKFEDNDKKTKKIVDYFTAGPANATRTKQNKENLTDPEKKDSNKMSKKNVGKDYIMKKFFQHTDKELKDNKVLTKHEEKESNTEEQDMINKLDKEIDKENAIVTKSNTALQADLDKQESFFAKLLNKDDKVTASRPSSALSTNTEESLVNARPTTPHCVIIDQREDSNDTDYSGSTINKEIDKSMALFDDDPEDVARVSSMRDLINKSALAKSDVSDESELERGNSDVSVNDTLDQKSGSINKSKATEGKDQNTETTKQESEQTSVKSVKHFECPECKKILPMKAVSEHSDYHLALKLREEERQHAREENKERTAKKVTKKDEGRKKKDEPRNENVGSISSFLIKVDEREPTETCKECGKRVPVQKYAEHLDFHEAQKLNRELNKRSAPSYFTGSAVKKRKTVSPVKKTKVISSSKSIDSFFK